MFYSALNQSVVCEESFAPASSLVDTEAALVFISFCNFMFPIKEV